MNESLPNMTPNRMLLPQFVAVSVSVSPKIQKLGENNLKKIQ
jgi:hypothetical protein